MPNPVPLATKEDEEKRAWVTAHHEVVRLIKECFGDRFSNNEIFDRLKISRRTGYRALGNDERIGKAPGRKPKIMESTIKDMIEYIEAGGCNNVGNVWKHLAMKFAPDCNPKTVQDSVKKSGFTNYHNQVKLDPLLNEHVPENQPTPAEEEAAAAAAEQLQQDETQALEDEDAQQSSPRAVDQNRTIHNVIDPAFQQQQSRTDTLKAAVLAAPEDHVRWVLQDLVGRVPEAALSVQMYFMPNAGAPAEHTAPSVTHMTSTAQMAPGSPVPTSPQHPQQPAHNENIIAGLTQKRRLAICRRCGEQYDRAENTMDTRECLYHKGSPQKISPDTEGTMEETPQSYIWSCCGGNGLVRGCNRAMHTTKKKRKYSKKRDAAEAGLDNNDVDDDDPDNDNDETTLMETSHLEPGGALVSQPPPQMAGAVDANIDTSLQDLQSQTVGTQLAQMAAQMTAPEAAMQAHPDGAAAFDGHGGMSHSGVKQVKLSPELNAQLRMVQAQTAREGLAHAASGGGQS